MSPFRVGTRLLLALLLGRAWHARRSGRRRPAALPDEGD